MWSVSVLELLLCHFPHCRKVTTSVSKEKKITLVRTSVILIFLGISIFSIPTNSKNIYGINIRAASNMCVILIPVVMPKNGPHQQCPEVLNFFQTHILKRWL